MLDPHDADLVDAAVSWARKHGQENRRVLSVSHVEWLRIWFAAWLHTVARALRQIVCGVGA